MVQVVAAEQGHLSEHVAGVGELVQLGFERTRFGRRGGDEYAEAREDAYRVRVAPLGLGAGAQVRAEVAALVDGAGRRVDGVGVPGGQGAAVAGGAGLHDDGPPLGRPGRVERSGDPEVLARVVDGVDLRRVDVPAPLAVLDDRVVLPAVPELLDGRDELVGPAVAGGVFGEGVLAEVPRGRRDGAGHHVPAEAAAADPVQRRGLAGDDEGVGVRGRDAAYQADPAGADGQCGQQGEWLERRRHGGGFTREGELVREEQGVESAAFGGACDVEQRVDVVDLRQVHGGVAPRGGVRSGGLDVQVQPERRPRESGHDGLLEVHVRPGGVRRIEVGRAVPGGATGRTPADAAPPTRPVFPRTPRGEATPPRAAGRPSGVEVAHLPVHRAPDRVGDPVDRRRIVR
ncbi:hypothetical protein OHA55_06675 [Streptomyces sp. NBC_00102]|nr:hypothetical protein [Streptomyces sp. NBC_00102]MCX5396677.1 hypothetical protein [Streptomyces sp. NBC_00102]